MFRVCLNSSLLRLPKKGNLIRFSEWQDFSTNTTNPGSMSWAVVGAALAASVNTGLAHGRIKSSSLEKLSLDQNGVDISRNLFEFSETQKNGRLLLNSFSEKEATTIVKLLPVSDLLAFLSLLARLPNHENLAMRRILRSVFEHAAELSQSDDVSYNNLMEFLSFSQKLDFYYHVLIFNIARRVEFFAHKLDINEINILLICLAKYEVYQEKCMKAIFDRLHTISQTGSPPVLSSVIHHLGKLSFDNQRSNAFRCPELDLGQAVLTDLCKHLTNRIGSLGEHQSSLLLSGLNRLRHKDEKLMHLVANKLENNVGNINNINALSVVFAILARHGCLTRSFFQMYEVKCSVESKMKTLNALSAMQALSGICKLCEGSHLFNLDDIVKAKNLALKVLTWTEEALLHKLSTTQTISILQSIAKLNLPFSNMDCASNEKNNKLNNLIITSTLSPTLIPSLLSNLSGVKITPLNNMNYLQTEDTQPRSSVLAFSTFPICPFDANKTRDILNSLEGGNIAILCDSLVTLQWWTPRSLFILALLIPIFKSKMHDMKALHLLSVFQTYIDWHFSDYELPWTLMYENILDNTNSKIFSIENMKNDEKSIFTWKYDLLYDTMEVLRKHEQFLASNYNILHKLQLLYNTVIFGCFDLLTKTKINSILNIQKAFFNPQSMEYNIIKNEKNNLINSIDNLQILAPTGNRIIQNENTISTQIKIDDLIYTSKFDDKLKDLLSGSSYYQYKTLSIYHSPIDSLSDIFNKHSNSINNFSIVSQCMETLVKLKPEDVYFTRCVNNFLSGSTKNINNNEENILENSENNINKLYKFRCCLDDLSLLLSQNNPTRHSSFFFVLPHAILCAKTEQGNMRYWSETNFDVFETSLNPIEKKTQKYFKNDNDLVFEDLCNENKLQTGSGFFFRLTQKSAQEIHDTSQTWQTIEPSYEILVDCNISGLKVDVLILSHYQ